MAFPLAAAVPSCMHSSLCDFCMKRNCFILTECNGSIQYDQYDQSCVPRQLKKGKRHVRMLGRLSEANGSFDSLKWMPTPVGKSGHPP
jgi:hypothetical protein